MKDINFLDLGIGWGQTKSGLERSGEIAWLNLSQAYHMNRYYKLKGKCRSDSSPIFNSEELDLPLSLYQTSYLSAMSSLKTENLSLFWGGDHSLSLATVQAFIDLYPNGKVIWIDAHADLNVPESSPTGNFHGMPVAYLLGIRKSPLRSPQGSLLRENQLCYLGLRSLDPFESQYLKKSDLTYYPDQAIRERGLQSICSEISSWVAGAPLHISFDVDVIDPEIAPSTGVPVPGGVTVKDVMLMAKSFSQLNIKSLDIVEVNPELGDEDSVQSTYQIAYQFLDPFLKSSRRFHDSNSANIERKYSNATAGHISFPAPDPF